MNEQAIVKYLEANYAKGYCEMDNPEVQVAWSRWCAPDGRNLFAVDQALSFFGQAAQDYFVAYCLNGKTDGRFLEIGSNDPVFINNTFMLETRFHWQGIMVEYLTDFLAGYQSIRPLSRHIIGDALSIDYHKALSQANYPASMDYLQVDLDWEGSLRAIEILEQQIFSDYRFAVVTYEHDHKNRQTRHAHKIASRKLFERNGYQLVFADVKDIAQRPYEDWYVSPDLVDMDRIKRIATNEALTWKEITLRLKSAQQT